MRAHLSHLRYVLLSLVLLPALATDVRAQRFEHQEVIPHAFDVAPGQTLHLVSDLGAIQVVGGNGSRFEMDVIKGVERGSAADAEALFRRFTVDVEETGQGVRIKGDYDGGAFRSNRNGLRVIYRIRVPRQFNLDLNTAGGSINVEAVDGDVRMKTSGGSLSLSDVGGTVNAHTSGGSITAEGIGGNATLETSGGSINVSDIGGAAKAHTSGGSISAEAVQGDLIAETSGGGIRLDDIVGSVDASTSGGGIVAALAGQPGGPVRLSTSGGSVTVHLDQDARMDVDAHASGGGVRSELPITGRLERNSIKGTLNGGGPLLSLHSSGGGVQIRTH